MNRHSVGSICVGFFLLIQIFQRIAFTFAPVGSTAEEALQVLGADVHVARGVLVFLSLPVLLGAYAVLAAEIPNRIGMVLVLVFFSMFVLLEMSYRGIEIGVVQMDWARNPLTAESLASYQLFQKYVKALYLPLLLSHALASGVTGFFLPSGYGLLKMGLWLNAIRAVIRILGMNFDIEWMNWLTGRNYFIAIILVYGLIFAGFVLRSRKASSTVVEVRTD